MKYASRFEGSLLRSLPALIAVIFFGGGCSLQGLSSEKQFNRELSVSSNYIWQHTFIYCKEGDILLIKADKGTWQTRSGSCDAAGVANSSSDETFLLAGVPHSALVAKLRDKKFLVGSGCRHVVSKDEAGELKLSCNNFIGKGEQDSGFNTNTGLVKASVTVMRSSNDSESPLKP